MNERVDQTIAVDTLLVEVEHRLAGSMRDADTVAPFGGDELVVVLHELAADKKWWFELTHPHPQITFIV